METLFKGIFDTELTSVISVPDFLLCIGMSLVIGLIIAFSYMYKTRYTKSFVITLALLPAVVCVVIMMVNGNVGTGVAVAGAFSLVRFRSWHSKRNWHLVFSHGRRSNCWHGIPWICSIVYNDYVCYLRAL